MKRSLFQTSEWWLFAAKATTGVMALSSPVSSSSALCAVNSLFWNSSIQNRSPETPKRTEVCSLPAVAPLSVNCPETLILPLSSSTRFSAPDSPARLKDRRWKASVSSITPSRLPRKSLSIFLRAFPPTRPASRESSSEPISPSRSPLPNAASVSHPAMSGWGN